MAGRIEPDIRDRTVSFTDKRGRSIAFTVKGATSDGSAIDAVRDLLEDGPAKFTVSVE